MTRPAKPDLPPITLPLLGELISRGDGSFVLKPSVPEKDLDTWITPKQAADLIGNVNPKSLYPLLGVYLVYRRPLPSRVVVSLKSALALKQATLDAEFWENAALQRRIKDQVKSIMTKFAEEALKA